MPDDTTLLTGTVKKSLSIARKRYEKQGLSEKEIKKKLAKLKKQLIQGRPAHGSGYARSKHAAKRDLDIAAGFTKDGLRAEKPNPPIPDVVTQKKP